MGYYTYHKLTTSGVQPDPEKLADDFLSITKYSLDTIENESVKWYKCTNNMITLSKLYPSTIFEIYGDGEESGDNWRAVFCNGEYKRVEAELVYPDINIQSIGGIGDRHPEFFR